MSIRPKSSWTYLILILACFFIPQVQAGWMDDLKNKTKAAKDAITTADEAVNSADGAVNEAANKAVNDAATSANEAVNKAVQPAPSY
jgi:hypothetical protein